MPLLPLVLIAAAAQLPAAPPPSPSPPPYPSTPPSQVQHPVRPAPSPMTGAPPPPPPHLLGDWGGIRPAMEAIGVNPTIQYIGMAAHNVDGGERKRGEYAGQLTIGAGIDLNRIAGVAGGAFQLAINNRHGRNLNATAGLEVLQQPQAIFGAGQIWRLSQAFYRQRLGTAEIKLGRMSVGEDFGTAPCFFESLYFCGIVPGHITPGYWYNPPVGVWGARVRASDRLGYTQVGVYERNPTNLREDRGFYLGTAGQTGALVPVERALAVNLGGDPARAGLYKIGVWYDTSINDDLVRDRTGGTALLSGSPLAQARGRWGGYVVTRQQVAAARPDGSGAVNLFASATLADGRTNLIRSIMVVGVTWSGVVPGRPRDEVGLAIGRTRVNDRLTRAQAAFAAATPTARPPQRGEWSGELTYSIALNPALGLRPNLQFYMDPGGRSDRRAVLVLGLGAFVTL